MPSCPHITVFKPRGWNPILEIQPKKIKIKDFVYVVCKHAKSSKYSKHLQKVFNICHFMRLQCKFTMFCKEFPHPPKKNHLFSCIVLNLVAAWFNNWEREGNFSEVSSLAFSHYREREWRKRHGSPIRNFQFHMNTATKDTSQVNPYM